MSDCEDRGKTRFFYTGNQVGFANRTGLFNFLAGGPLGSGISAGIIESKFFPPPVSRSPWKNENATLSQEILNASFPFIELVWIADIELNEDTVFRVSNRNIYVEGDDGIPRFYEARVKRSPNGKTTLGEWLNPNFQIGDLRLTLNNRDGFFNPFLPQGEDFQLWTNSKVTVRVGFGEKFSNYFAIYEGFVASKQGLQTSETEIVLKVRDRFETDDIAIPIQKYDRVAFPLIQKEGEGKGIPLVYGDWDVEVDDFGEIPALCLNAKDSAPSGWQFKISQLSLIEIGDIFLHRGDRNKDSVDGPIKIIDAIVEKNLGSGEFSIPANTLAFEESFVVLKSKKAGPASGLDFITSDEINFVENNIRPGDTVTKKSTSETSTVSTVANFQLTLSGGVTYAENDEYSIETSFYHFFKSDKISVKCKGKDVRLFFVGRLTDVGLNDAIPTSLSVDLNDSFWFVDNGKQQVFQIGFDNKIKRTIDFNIIDPAITEISAITVQTDDTIWVVDRPQSKIYRFILEDNETGLSFTTAEVTGLGVTLNNIKGLSIDEGNILYIYDNDTGNFFKVNPFGALIPFVVGSWNRTVFEPLAIDIEDISVDVNLLHVIVIDRATGKLFRIDRDTGVLIIGSDFLLTQISEDVSFPVGISSAQDGTIFVMNRDDLAIYNYNEDANSSFNAGFITRDLLQRLTGKTPTDFDLTWNETARRDLTQFKSRLFLQSKSTLMKIIHKFLGEVNTSFFAIFGKFSLFHITFDNFRNDGDFIREGDIKQNSFSPKKEHNQYFNSITSDFRFLPFSNTDKTSDTYVSPKGVSLAGKEINRVIKQASLYRREDIDKLLPLFVRLSSADPEFVDTTVGFRQLFTQQTRFFRINFDAALDCNSGLKRGGRRFNNIPAFVREIGINLENMTLQLKLWSLGTTAFGDFVPVGTNGGGEFDKIVLTTLGTVGFISPTGIIIGNTTNTLTIEDVNGNDAETRSSGVVGLAWKPGYKIAIVDASDQSIIETNEIESVSGQIITFVNNFSISILNSVKNAADFIDSGHFIRYSNFDETSEAQKEDYSHLSRPTLSYASTSTQEVEDQKAGNHNLPDDRPPYILHPSDFQSF